ncbi:hypothetical protein GGD65_006326 [Bradyrhizobium sp. CIR18]|nr:hypothetical protein [Bradyrhizobium sp. CIR18]
MRLSAAKLFCEDKRTSVSGQNLDLDLDCCKFMEMTEPRIVLIQNAYPGSLTPGWNMSECNQRGFDGFVTREC